MSDVNESHEDVHDGGGAAVAVEEATRTRPERRVERMPPWKVLLHNDDHNIMEDVVKTIRQITSLTLEESVHRMLEAHRRGVALLLVTHREHAELLQEQFTSKTLIVTIEPDA